MSIQPTDIKKRYSVAAAAGNTTAGTAPTSLGDQVSTTDIPNNSLGNIFGDITGDESAAGVVKYRCIFIGNEHATLTLQAADVSVVNQVANGASIAVAVDNIAASPKGSASAQATTIPNETTVPVAVGAFGTGPVVIGDIPAGSVRAVWIRQTTPIGATSPLPDGVDAFDLLINGDTLP